MKKIAVAITLALGGFTTIASQAIPPENSWYSAFRLGGSKNRHVHFDDNNGYFAPTLIDEHTYPAYLGGYIYTGYQTNKYLAFEIGYNWIGRMPYHSDFAQGAYKIQGLQLTTKIDYPLKLIPGMTLFARGGALLWRGDAVQKNDFFERSISDHDLGASPIIILGSEFTINQYWSGTCEYQWSNNLGIYKILGIRPTNDTFGITLIHKHEKDTDTSFLDTISDVLKPDPPVIHKTKYYTLKYNILFAFNQTNLRYQDRQSLDRICRQISKMKFEKLIINIQGFTDRIGSNKYNIELSEKRAKVIVNYLVAKGIPLAKIFIKGMGAAQSASGDHCNKIKDHESLIKCFTPDRRVELFIEAKKAKRYNDDRFHR